MVSKTPKHDMWTENPLQIIQICSNFLESFLPKVLEAGGKPLVKVCLIYLKHSVRDQSLKSAHFICSTVVYL